MKLTRRRLEQIIREETAQALREKKEKESKRTGRFKDCDGRGNDAHSADGRFSSKDDAASHSLYFSCPEYPYRVRKGMKAITDPKDAGRGEDKDKGKGRYRVRDNAKLWEDELHQAHDDLQFQPDDEHELAEEIDGQDSLYFRHIIRQELEKLAGQLSGGKRSGGCSWDDVLTVMKQWKAAEQYKPPKPKAGGDAS